MVIYPPLGHRLNDLRVQDLRASVAHDRLVARACPAQPDARTTLARYVMAAIAAIAFVLGFR